MAWAGISAEAVHFTDGRLSATGNSALMGLAAGFALYCLVHAINRPFVNRAERYFPLGAAALCVAQVFIENIPLSTMYGLCSGLFIASSLLEYLPHAGLSRRLLKIGLSAGIFTTAVYPFGVAYALISPHIAPLGMRIITYLFLAALAAGISLLRRGETKGQNARIDMPIKLRPAFLPMLIAVVIMATLNHLINSGILEQSGGTANAPLIFFFNVTLRLPMGVLLGYWLDRGRWQIAVGFPLALMIGGCAISLFMGGAAGDYAMLSVFNFGGAAIVMLIHILGMQTSLWRNHNAAAACFGGLTHFMLVAFFNMNTLGISPEFFGETLRRPLTFAVIVLGLPAFLLIVQFLANERLRETMRGFFGLHTEPFQALCATADEPAAANEDGAGFTQLEKDIVKLLMEGYTQYGISRKMQLQSGEVAKHIQFIRERIVGISESDEVVEAIVKDYRLTKRETDILRRLMQNMGNDEIAAELILSQETVKVHVRNLMRKLPVENRSDVTAWVESFSAKME